MAPVPPVKMATQVQNATKSAIPAAKTTNATPTTPVSPVEMAIQARLVQIHVTLVVKDKLVTRMGPVHAILVFTDPSVLKFVMLVARGTDVVPMEHVALVGVVTLALSVRQGLRLNVLQPMNMQRFSSRNFKHDMSEVLRR